jgi:7-cyano-7-deazaguanine reductase
LPDKDSLAGGIEKGESMDKSGKREEILAQIKDPGTVAGEVLEVLDYGYAATRDVEIKIDQPEFTSLCPRSGLPDFGRISIRYVPNEKIVELKSLKYYLLQYRNVGIFYEHVVNCILDDLVDALKPRFMEVTGSFTPRGGILTSARAEYREETAGGE